MSADVATTHTPIVEARSVWLSYNDTPALVDVDLSIDAGDKVAVMGPSGSGKSSLLHCLCGVLAPERGEVSFDGEPLSGLRESRRSEMRLRRMGVVFQFGDLVPELTLLENVMMPLLLTGHRRAAAARASHEVLGELGVDDVADRRAGAVSGGQAQRAAVARAIVHNPPVIFADEPTGSLDTVNSEAVLDALVGLADARGSAVIVITHDHQVASHFDRVVTMRDGRISLPAAAVLR